MSRPLRGLPVAIIDTETTGLIPAESHVIEVAIAHMALGQGTPELSWHSLIRPPVPIPEAATEIHGISDKDVADAPTFEQAAQVIRVHLSGRQVCAYKAPFDAAMLSAEFARVDPESVPMRPADWLDPLVWVWGIDQFCNGKNLRAACERRGIAFPPHGARADTMATGLLVQQLLAEMANTTRQWSGTKSFSVPRLAWSGLVEFLLWQGRSALQSEMEMAEWAAKSGRAYTCTWHEILGVEPPAAPEPPEAEWNIEEDGTIRRET